MVARGPNHNQQRILGILASGNHGALTHNDWQQVAQMEAVNNATVAAGGQAVYNYPEPPPPDFRPSPPDFRPPTFYTAPPSFGPSFPAPAKPPPPPPPPAPPAPSWLTEKTFQPMDGVKQADPDTVLFDEESVSPELLIELQYEDLAGIEMANISRSDIIDGQDVIYSPIKNLSEVRRRYNPNNIIPLSENANSFFGKFSINLNLRNGKVPYFDDEGNLIIEINDVRNDEVIEAQIDTSGTINEVDLL